MSDCLFCKIVAGDVPAIRIAESERAIAFMDIFPAAPGHALVIPRAHSDDALAAADDDLAACMQLASQVGNAAVSQLGATGVTFQSLARPDAGQTVFHLHIHVIPRVAGDDFRFPWPHVDGDIAEIEGHAARLRAAL
jgi:histidine triad (HIT) family protein